MTHPDIAETQPEAPAPADGFIWLIRQALFILTPFFMDGANGDAESARAAAKELLASYQIGTAEELQLATQCIVFAYASMDTLRQTRTDPDMCNTRRLRLRAAAASLDRASHRSCRGLDALRKSRTPMSAPPQVPPEPHLLGSRNDPLGIMQDLTRKIAQHRERMAAAPAASPAGPAAPAIVMNREQRRSAELAATYEARRTQA